MIPEWEKHAILDTSRTMQPEIDAAAITVSLKELQERDPAAADRLIPMVFRELHNLAELYIRREGPNHTLQPTALVHECYLRLVADQARDWQNRAQFVGVAASIMRRLLIDHARKIHAEKRQLAEPHMCAAGMSAHEAEDLLNLNLALDRLAKSNARYAKVVELRYFGGLSIDEIADVMQTSPMTVKRDWTAARAWLKQQVTERPRHL